MHLLISDTWPRFASFNSKTIFLALKKTIFKIWLIGLIRKKPAWAKTNEAENDKRKFILQKSVSSSTKANQ